MEIFQADAAPGDLPSYEALGSELASEFKRRLVFINKTEVFHLFNLVVSESIRRKRLIVSDVVYYYLFTNCLEKLREVDRISSKMKAFVFISKYPIDFLVNNFKLMRKDLIAYHNQISEILYSPRALGSFSNKESLKELDLYEITFPGKRKCQFPPVRFIAVGYQDKGNSRNKAIDGSPDWREVAMANLKTSPSKIEKAIKSNDQLRLLLSDSLRELREKSLRRSTKRRRQEFSFLD